MRVPRSCGKCKSMRSPGKVRPLCHEPTTHGNTCTNNSPYNHLLIAHRPSLIPRSVVQAPHGKPYFVFIPHGSRYRCRVLLTLGTSVN